MAEQTPTEAPPGLSTLATGIINDVQDLIKQQLALFQHEIEAGFHQSKEAIAVLFWGLGIALVGVCLLGFMGAYFLHWAAPTWPLWACFGVAGGVVTGVGVALFFVGKKHMEAIHALPEKSVEELKENVQWIMNNPPK
jgi:hypothetical protein